MANYGKNSYYIIEEILFETPLDGYTFFDGKEQVSLTQYYKSHYNLTINVSKQPLIKAALDKKAKEKNMEVILVPELLLISGLPDNFDERKRR